MADAVFDALKNYWGYTSFRPQQREAVDCVLQHRDSVVVLPTGGGKSLCFQLPAVVMEGMAVVVSPLIALMKDQVDALRGLGITAAAVNSTITETERQQIHADIKARKLKLLYATPERLVQERFITYLRNNHLSFVAVDEAHCISQWGHDFRPEFRALGVLREAFPETGIHAYTATATPQVREDIAVQLRLRNAVYHTGAFDRPNLIYRVRPRENEMLQVAEVLQRHEGESGIIYCLRRKDVDALCALLTSQGHKALPYHAGMENGPRKRNQEAFLRDEANIIVATVAFGMGIDKPDVRFVLHMGMPKSIEHYQQESGRAGRDGLQSECVLLYGMRDFKMWQSFAEKEASEATPAALRKLGQMLDYCTGTTCRHAALTNYFGERMRVEKCISCDACLGEQDTMDNSAEVARLLLQAVEQTHQRFGPQYVAKLLCGERDERMQRYGHTQASSFGALRGNQAQGVRQWLEQLAEQQFLEQSGDYNTLSLTPEGSAFLRGASSRMPVLVGSGGAGTRARRARSSEPMLMTTPEHKALFQSLKELRQQIAREEGTAPYMVFGDRTLVAIAVTRPTTLEAFAQVHGVGSIKHEKYGARFVEHVRDHCEHHRLQGNVPAPAPTGSGVPSGLQREHGKRRALELFRRGASIEEVAEDLQRAPSTVSNYLGELITLGEIEDISPWVDPDTEARVAAAAEDLQGPAMRPVYEALKGEVPYQQIRLVLSRMRRGSSV